MGRIVYLGIVLGLGFSYIHTCYAQNNLVLTNQNVFVGNGAGLRNTNGTANVFIGYNAGQASTSSVANVFVGSQAGANNTTGLGNLFLGQQAGLNNSEGNYNLFMGNGAGRGTTTGAGNTSIGDGAFLSNTTGAGNTAIGRYAGINITTGSNNTFIGLAATAPSGSGTISNATAIGYNAQVTASNSMVLGSGVNVGIGTSAPNNKLEVVSSASNTSGLRLTNLKSSSPVTVATAKYLTVDANGDVVLGSASGSGRVASEDANWTIDGEHLKNTNAGGIIIGPGVNTTPAGYRLYVADGVLTEKLKVAVKSTNDWSDRVFEGSYRLRSLKEVEQFIDRNKHLPGVPSAEEVVVQGVDVGQMQAKLLEKVEELTLYVIDLKKENETLKKKVSKIESGRRARVKGKL